MNKRAYLQIGRTRLVILAILGVLSLVSLATGCSSVGYYSQAVNGHLKLMQAREPIDEVLAKPDTPPELREKLITVMNAREFAVTELGLPDNDSYSTFVQTNRRAVTWNVVAAEEFSLNAKTWCFPVAGCVSYRGYFNRDRADTYANQLAEQGFDVTVGGASAYSTLGWFEDPVLDTMLRGPDTRFVGTLFHELAHQRLYVKDDSDFNEAFATFVEQQGVQQWLEKRGEADRIAAYEQSERRVAQFLELLQRAREALIQLYAKDIDETSMRASKESTFQQLRAEYTRLKGSWGGYSGYDGWFHRELNNARLVAVATYHRYVPAFEAMFIEAGEDLRRFYEVASVTAELPIDKRRERLEAYLAALKATN